MFSPVHPVLIDNFKGLKYQLRYFKIYLIDLYIDIFHNCVHIHSYEIEQ